MCTGAAASTFEVSNKVHRTNKIEIKEAGRMLIINVPLFFAFKPIISVSLTLVFTNN